MKFIRSLSGSLIPLNAITEIGPVWKNIDGHVRTIYTENGETHTALHEDCDAETLMGGTAVIPNTDHGLELVTVIQGDGLAIARYPIIGWIVHPGATDSETARPVALSGGWEGPWDASTGVLNHKTGVVYMRDGYCDDLGAFVRFVAASLGVEVPDCYALDPDREVER